MRLTLLLLATCGLAASALAADPRPNILFIYADDWGWGDVACHGHPDLKTPNIDRLAREGTDFQQFTVANPVCSPSRTAILTGHYPARHGIHQHIAAPDENAARGMPDWLDPKVTLLPRLMQQAGYATAHYGKWHLGRDGAQPAPLPAEYGYDDAAVWTGPGRNVFDGTRYAATPGDAHGEGSASFLTTAATEHALRFIRTAKDKPFYVNLWIHETHHLVSATAEDKQAYPDTAEPQRTYYSAITRADKQIGRLLDLIDELDLARNTLVIFSSDNGPENSMPNRGEKFYFSVGETGGLRGRKRSLYLGGVNVPFIVRWPGIVPAGRVDKTSVITGVDVMPTLLSATGIAAPANYVSDGINVLPVFKGEPFERKTPIFWEWRGPHAKEADWPSHAIRHGDHVLLHDETAGRIELFDVINDRAQQHNLASANPGLVKDLRAKLDAWRQSIPSFKQSPGRRAASLPATAAPKPGAQNLTATFKRWDTNQDGSLSLKEYADGLTKNENAERRFKNFDKNNDGKVSQEEFTRR